MGRIHRFFKFVSWAMLGVGVFSLITGLLSLLGFSESIHDSMGSKTLFTFVQGGAFFMVCGIIHIGAGLVGHSVFLNKTNYNQCGLIGMFTLVWQLSAFIYMLTLRYISIRLALMLILPLLYVTLLIPIQLIESSSLHKANASSGNPQTDKAFVSKRIFNNTNFTFKRKTFVAPRIGASNKTFRINRLFQQNGKRKSTNIISLFTLSGRRRSGRNLRIRNFTRK